MISKMGLVASGWSSLAMKKFALVHGAIVHGVPTRYGSERNTRSASLAIDSQAVSLAIDSQAVSLAITESRNTTSPPEPKFFVKFILGPEPDSRIRRKKLHTGHRSPQNRFFENLYKSLFPS